MYASDPMAKPTKREPATTFLRVPLGASAVCTESNFSFGPAHALVDVSSGGRLSSARFYKIGATDHGWAALDGKTPGVTYSHDSCRAPRSRRRCHALSIQVRHAARQKGWRDRTTPNEHPTRHLPSKRIN